MKISTRILILGAAVLGSGCGDDGLTSFGDSWAPADDPAWRCVGASSIVGQDEEPRWAIPEQISGTFTSWELDGNARDHTFFVGGSGPEHEGPCATGEGELVGLALPMGPLTESGESESHLFIGMSDGARSYDVATEAVGAEVVVMEVACGLFEGGYRGFYPSSGTVEVMTMPSPQAPLRIVGDLEGDCAADFDLEFVFPSDYFEDTGG